VRGAHILERRRQHQEPVRRQNLLIFPSVRDQTETTQVVDRPKDASTAAIAAKIA
jgi:hypothetical protein